MYLRELILTNFFKLVLIHVSKLCMSLKRKELEIC